MSEEERASDSAQKKRKELPTLFAQVCMCVVQEC